MYIYIYIYIYMCIYICRYIYICLLQAFSMSHTCL